VHVVAAVEIQEFPVELPLVFQVADPLAVLFQGFFILPVLQGGAEVGGVGAGDALGGVYCNARVGFTVYVGIGSLCVGRYGIQCRQGKRAQGN